MTLDGFLSLLKYSPERIYFSDTITLIDSLYDYTPTAFQNGELHNAAEENVGSCKIFSFGLMHRLSEETTLHCFGDYYRQDVLLNPEGEGHLNIRQFIQTGWAGIQFAGTALHAKANLS